MNILFVPGVTLNHLRTPFPFSLEQFHRSLQTLLPTFLTLVCSESNKALLKIHIILHWCSDHLEVGPSQETFIVIMLILSSPPSHSPLSSSITNTTSPFHLVHWASCVSLKYGYLTQKIYHAWWLPSQLNISKLFHSYPFLCFTQSHVLEPQGLKYTKKTWLLTKFSFPCIIKS